MMFKLLKKYKTSILAAIAEIVIVFIGISISLYIDEQQEEKENTEKEEVYLKEIYYEINSDITALGLKLNWISEVRSKVAYLLNAMHYPDSLTISSNEFKQTMGNAFILDPFVSKDHTFTDLTSTGNIKLIQDSDLRKNIYIYYSLVKRLNKLEEINSKPSSELLTNDIMRKFPLREVFNYDERYENLAHLTEINFDFFQDPLSEKYITIENALLLRISLLRFEFRNYSQCIEQAYQIRLKTGKLFNLPNDETFLDEFKKSKLKAGDFYKEFTSRNGEFYPLEIVLNNDGYALLKSDPKRGLELLLLNTLLYPYSDNVWDSAGDAYMANNNQKKALEMYAKAMEINPMNEDYRKKYNDLINKLK